MTDLDFESDQLLVLLTDALHAGPGSPAWHDALGRLRESGVQSADELTLLLRVREHLESGRSFRTVRAGGGFTRQLMRSLDVEPAETRTPRHNSMMLLACVAIVLLTVAAISTIIWRNRGTVSGDGPNNVESANGVLINTVASTDFDNGLPADWKVIGGLPLTTNHNALMPDPARQSQATGGGIAWNSPIRSGEPFSFSAVYHLPRGESDWAAELFVTDDPTFDVSTAVTSHELVWLCQAHQCSVISPSGTVLAQQAAPGETRNAVAVRLTVTGSRIMVEQGGKLLWAGPHELDMAKGRTVGLRFLRNGTAATFDAGFSRVRVNMRQTGP